MHPAAIASQAPDRPAVIMAGSGQRDDVRRARRRARTASPTCCASEASGRATRWRSSPRTIRGSSRSPGRRSGPGCTTRRSTPTSPPTRRRTSSTTAAPPWSCRRRALAPVAAAAFTADATPKRRASGCCSAADAATAGSGTRRWSTRSPSTPIADEMRRRLHAVLVGHHGASEGHQAPAHAGAARPGTAGARCRSCRRSGFGAGDVYLCPAPLYHAAPLAWSMGAQRLGGTVVVMERFDPARGARAHRAAPGDPRPVRADDVRPHAEAAGRRARRATTCRA